ncbi:hypothetical protein DL98DRAFT_595712 [Cadophora sp. DSE1049]|nr:hypothetical protein DL98DRAFT_595712 [Cadophora sp. DSE1049]
MGFRGMLPRRGRRWLLGRQDEDGEGVDDGNETEGEDEAGEEDGPRPGPGAPNKGPQKPPAPPGQVAKTSISTTSTTSEETTQTTSSTSTTSSEESITSTTTSSEESTTTTFSSETTTSTTSTPVLLTSNTQLPFSTVSQPQTSSFSFVPPPATFSFVSTTAFSTSLLASSIPFSTLSRTSVTPTTAPVIFTPSPSSTATQSNGNANPPSVVSTSASTSSSTSSASTSPSAISAAYGISSGKSAPTATVIGIGVSIGVVTVLISGLLLFFLRRRRKHQSYLTGRASATTYQSFWDRVSGLPPNLGGRPAPPSKTSPYTQDFNSYTPFSPPPVQRQFDTSSSDDNVDMPPPALFIPQIMTNAAPPPPPPIFTNQPYQAFPQNQQPLRLNPTTQPYGTTTTIRTGPLSLSWFLGKPSKILKPSPQTPGFIPPTGNGNLSPNTNAEKQKMETQITQMEADMHEQEQRWESSRREMAQRQSGLTESNPQSQSQPTPNPNSNNRQTLQSEGWESGIGDARSARFLSGIGSETTGRGSVTIQDARLDFIQPVTKEQIVQNEMGMQMDVEDERRKVENARRAKWESSPDSLNELPRWRDPVLSIFEEVRGRTSGDVERDEDVYGGGGQGPVSPRRVV